MDPFTAGVSIDAAGVYTITLAGELDMASRGVLRELIGACATAGATAIRFEMADVTLCGSDCAAAIALATTFDVPVTVAHPSRCVLRTLEITGLDRYVEFDV